MPKYKLYPKDFQPIPTPEEEAREDAAIKQGRASSRALLAMLLVMGCAFFRNELYDLGNAIWRLLS